MSSSSRDEYYDEVVRRMVSLPRNLLGGFSRAMGIGGGGGRRQDNHYYPHQSLHLQPPPQQPLTAYPYYPQQPSMVQDEWSFLTTFESSYGQKHPFFYACRFNESLKLAQGERKFLFMYLHYPDHSNLLTSSFCKETLGSESVIQFLDAKFVSWGGLADRGDGLNMANTLRPSTFPFCAVIAPSADDNITVLQQIEGPVSPAELVEILQRTVEDQGVAFGSLRANKEDKKRRDDRRLREEQDLAYFAALKIDQEKERVKNSPSTSSASKVQKPTEEAKKASKQTVIRPTKVRETSAATSTMENQNRSNAIKAKDTTQLTQILVRFPNGERLEQSFSVSDRIKAVFRYVDSVGVEGVGNYRLVSSFPRKAYGVDQMNMSFKEAGLYPKATLFLEPL